MKIELKEPHILLFFFYHYDCLNHGTDANSVLPRQTPIGQIAHG